jgi:dienelactone hydrolase
MRFRLLAVLCALLCAGRAGALCVGDCDGDGAVTIAELIGGVAQSLAPGAPQTCGAFDRNGDSRVTIDELIAAVRSALDGCPLEPIAFSAALDPDGPALLITPAAPLRGASVYAVALTGGIADAAGRSLQASAAFRELKGTDEPAGAGPIALFAADPDAAGNPYPDGRLVIDGGVRIPDRFALRGLPDTPELATAREVARDIADAIGAAGFFSTTAPLRIALSSAVDLQTVTPDTVKLFARRDAQLELAPVLDDLERIGVPSGTVALAISFPTQTIEDDLLAIRARLDQRLSDGSLRVILADPDPDDDLVIGVFQRGAPEFAAFFAANPEVATVVHGLLPSPDFRGAGGIFDADKVSGAAAAADALLDVYLTLPASAGPHRVVILQHGFAGDNSFGLTVANELARDGLAGIAISAVLHGRRGNFLDLLSSTPLQVRDIFRQTNADQMALVRGIQAGVDVDADGAPDLDPDGLGYLGVSLGGILGGTFVAVEPAIQMAVLNVAGGRVAFLGDNPGTRPFYSQYYAMLSGLDMNSAEFEIFRQRLLALGQQALDPADPLDYARRWSIEPFPGFTPRRVLMQEGIGDQLVDNASSEALAAAGGLSANEPLSDPAGVSGLWRFDPPGGHGIFGRTDVRAQALRFLASGGTEIIAPNGQPEGTCSRCGITTRNR